MEDYRLLMNAIKHESKVDKLLERRRDLFHELFPFPDLRALRLSPEAVAGFFDAVKGSGYQYKPDISSWFRTGAS